MKTYRIWILWTDKSESYGRTVRAIDPEAALLAANRMGDFAGLGYRWPHYIGAHAQEVKE